MTDEIDKQQEIEERVTSGASHTGHPVKQDRKTESGDNEIHIASQPPMSLPQVNPGGGATVGTSPVLQELNNLEGEPAQVNEQIFEEIPVEVCGQLYQTTLEVGFALKNKGMPIRELPESRVKTQGEIIYGILKKNRISVKYIEVFMLGAGMMGDWKYMSTFAEEQKREDKVRGKPKENADGKYGRLNNGL